MPEIEYGNSGCSNTIVVRLLIALLLVVSTSPVWARARITAVKLSPEFRPFSARVKAYMELQDRAGKAIGTLKDKSDVAEVKAHKQALAGAIRAARPEAKPGNVFVPEVQPLFRRVIRSEVHGKGGAPAKQTIMDENPSKSGEAAKVKLAVNAIYPDDVATTTMPPTLLLRLPTLPDALKYLFVGRTLVLRDETAGLIVDYLPNAMPAVPARKKKK
jgi:hypothetical protein